MRKKLPKLLDLLLSKYIDWTVKLRSYTMRKNLPKTLDLLIFSIYSLNFSLEFLELLKFSHNLPNISKFLPPQRRKTLHSYFLLIETKLHQFSQFFSHSVSKTDLNLNT